MQIKTPKCTVLFLISFCFLFPLPGCNSDKKNSKINEVSILPKEKNIVETIVLNKQDFFREIISNGKLYAIQKAELYFKNPGIIETISWHNGKSVAKGAELVRLQNQEYLFQLKKAEVAMEKSEIDKIDALLSMGYKSGELNIPIEHIRIANIRSGFNQARIQMDEANFNLKNMLLVAPFSGKVEGLKQKPFEKTDLSKPFCTLINDSYFTIEFPLLETEISQVQSDQKVTVSPIAGAKISTGKITEINPRIDENGLVWLKAEVKNPGAYMDGMNVKVSIKKGIANQLVVPKEAVVLRQNREVLFRYTNGFAYWTYIKTLDENENQYSVESAEGATLEAGDTVIVSNNLNLAHESEVEMK